VTASKLRDQQILFRGAGSAAFGMAEQIASARTLEELAPDQGRARSGLFDVNGLVEPSRTDLSDFQKPYAHAHPR
jgi:malate dehydrogenase (oxaloacetate-decarboxylating)(NADP+)